MDTVIDPINVRGASTWFAASPVLDSLLSLREPCSEEMDPAQRLTRRYAVMNAMRLWTVVQKTLAEFKEPVRTVTIDAPKGRWRWPADGVGERMDMHFHVEILAPRSTLAMVLHVQATPALVPHLDVHSETTAGGRRIWITEPAAVPLGYAEARALLTTLLFSIDADQLVLGRDPRSQA